MQSMKKRRWIIFVAIMSIYLMIEGMCFFGLALIKKKSGTQYDPIPSELSIKQRQSIQDLLRRKVGKNMALDPDLGWVPVSEANSAGMRDDREYKRVPAASTTRIAIFGDSFTYGSDVALNQSWGKQLAQLDPDVLEVLNYGVGAYGLDQAYLRYLKTGNDFSPHIVFIGYMSENISRNVNVFRPFYTRYYRNAIFTKPRFQINGGILDLIRNPLSTFKDYENILRNDKEVLAKLGENDYHYGINYHRHSIDYLPSVRFAKVFWYTVNKKVLNPIFSSDGMYNVESEAYHITVKIIDTFYKKVLENGGLPVVVIFPDIGDQQRSRTGKTRRYLPLLIHLQNTNYYHIDGLDALVPHESEYTVGELVVEWGHFSPLGSKIIAQFMYDNLNNWNFLSAPDLGKAVAEEQTRLGIGIDAESQSSGRASREDGQGLSH